MILVLLGAPGAGKGTQAVDLADELGVIHLSTGELFRANLRERTPLGMEAESYMNRGELVPDEVVIAMMRERLAEGDAAGGAVLDGFPRTVAQAEELDEMLRSSGRQEPYALLIDVPTDALMRRLTGRRVCRNCGAIYHVEFKPPKVDGVCDKCGGELYQRDDDMPETVRNRLEVYERETAPVIGYYSERERLISVDGDADPVTVGERVLRAVRELRLAAESGERVRQSSPEVASDD
jgi:adenylate kinase